MRVLFRADASVETGTGHVVRCATLAEALQAHGADVAFACRELPGNLLAWLRQKGFTTFALDGDRLDTLAQGTAQIQASVDELLSAAGNWKNSAEIDWLIVDHYGLDARWENRMRAHCRKILAIDDLANRSHDCEGLLDQNLLDNGGNPYIDLIPSHCAPLLGPRFALLRQEFRQAREAMQAENPYIAKHLTPDDALRILVLFGGSDPTRECFKALDALQLLPPDCKIQVDLVAGASNPNFEALQTRCATVPQVRLHRQVNAMADLMGRADLSIGAGGTTTWERCCLGIPSIIVAVADNQVEISRNLAQGGYQVYLGESPQVSAEQLSQTILDLIQNPEQRATLSSRTMALVDGLGVQRVVHYLLQDASHGARHNESCR